MVQTTLIHNFCTSFVHSKHIETIQSPTAQILPFAASCIRLKHLSITYRHAERERDFFAILSLLPKLVHLKIGNPTFCNKSLKLEIHSGLERLIIYGITQVFLTQFYRSLDDGYLRLSNLKHLALDLDYSTLPDRFIRILARTSPEIKSLTLKYSTLYPKFIHEICTLMTHLVTLKISKTEFSFYSSDWFHVIRFICTAMPNLICLSLNMCKINDTITELDIQESEVFDSTFDRKFNSHYLNSLKLFDIGETRPDIATLNQIILRFPFLKSLRMDITSSKLDIMSSIFHDRLQILETLELRFGKPRGDPIRSMAQNNLPAQVRLPNLKNLSLWCISNFPSNLVQPNLMNISKLFLHYVSEPSAERFALPNLKELNIQCLSSRAHSTCVQLLESLSFGSQKLKVLIIDAMYHESSELSHETVVALHRTSPNLEKLFMYQFRLNRDSLKYLALGWPQLVELSLRGSEACGVISECSNKEFVRKLIQNHKMLKILDVECAFVDTDQFPLSKYESNGRIDSTLYLDYARKLSTEFNLRRVHFKGRLLNV